MLTTLRSKMLLLVILLMSLTTLAIVLITQLNFERTIQQVHGELAQSMLQFATQAVENEYRKVVQTKVSNTTRQREVLKNMTDGAFAVLNEFTALAEAGILSEAEAQRRSVEWLNRFHYGQDQYFFACDMLLRGLAHPHEAMRGQTWLGFQDMRLEETFAAMRTRIAQGIESQYSVFEWPRLRDRQRVKQLGYLRYDPRRQWIVGTALEIEELAADAQQVLQAVIPALKQVFENQRFAQIGYVFLFDHQGLVLIHPEFVGKNLADVQETLSGIPLAGRLMTAASDPTQAIEIAGPEYRRQIVYVQHYLNLNWYIAAAMYTEAISAPARKLTTQQAVIIFTILVLGILLASLVSHRMARHLALLTEYARQLPQSDWTSHDILAITQIEIHAPRSEVGELAHAFVLMEAQLRRQIRENVRYQEHLEELVECRTAELSRSEEEVRALNRELEARVQQRTAELEAANRELQSFAYVVSHDLKAPLRAISRLAQWVRDDYADAVNAKGQEMLTLLVGRVKRMDDLINGILEYSRIGRIHNAIGTIDLNLLLVEILDSLAPPEYIQITIAPNLPIMIADRTRITQIFQNLLSNAIKFMDKPQGHITVNCQDGGSSWIFSIADNGPGIEMKHHERIFQIFQTLQSRDEVESTGIGLTLVKKIVEWYGGKIWLESAVGQGSTFFFSIPKHDGPISG